MKKLLAVLLVAVFIGSLILLIRQNQAQQKLHADNEGLSQQLGQLQADNESLSNRLAASNSRSLSDEQMNELLKLRGEVAVLRRQLNDQAALREQNSRPQVQITSPQNQVAQLSPQDAFILQHAHTVDAMKALGLAMRLFAEDHTNQYATSYDQLTNELSDIHVLYNVSLDSIEFMNVGLVNESMPDKIVFREKAPRQGPNGGWERLYSLGDGSVESQNSEDGNFDAYEQQHMVSPQNP